MMKDLNEEKVYTAIEKGVYNAVFDFLNEFIPVDSAIEEGVANAFSKQMDQYFNCVPVAIEKGVYRSMIDIEQNNKEI